MSRPVKNLVIEHYKQRFDGVDGVVLINTRGVNASQNDELRRDMSDKGIRVTVVKNRLARQAFVGTNLENLNDLFEGGCAVVYGGESVVNVARALVDHAKGRPHIEFKGAVLEGTIFSANEVETLSKYPTREEAIADIVGALLGPGAELAAALEGPGVSLAGILKAIEEQAEEAA